MHTIVASFEQVYRRQSDILIIFKLVPKIFKIIFLRFVYSN